jgi:hypothetical protein
MRSVGFLALGIVVGVVAVQAAHADPAPQKTVCTDLSGIRNARPAEEFMDNNIAAGRVHFVAAGNLVLCAW